MGRSAPAGCKHTSFGPSRFRARVRTRAVWHLWLGVAATVAALIMFVFCSLKG